MFAVEVALDKKRALEPCRPAGEGFWCEANCIRTTANSQAPTNAEGRGHNPDLPICLDAELIITGDRHVRRGILHHRGTRQYRHGSLPRR